MRKARERRRRFAQTIQDSARSTPVRQGSLVDSFRSSIGGHGSASGRQDTAASIMPPPSTPPRKWQSLSTDFDYDLAQSELGNGTKRKRVISNEGNDHRTPKTTKIGHRRSQTVGNSVMSAPPRGFSHSPYKSRIDISTVPKGSMLNDILMKQARRLAPTAKSDTTHTDYFRLKALGIDPDTPVVPTGKKRTRAESMTNGDSRIIEKVGHETQPGGQLGTQETSQSLTIPSKTHHTTKNDDDDEALFAQIRSVREALAESEQWMHSERQSMERSTPSKQPRPSTSPPHLPSEETPAQRRLRELKERGHQPSRTEVRLRALGDEALLPKGFWDGEGMGLSLVKGREEEGVEWGINGVMQQQQQRQLPNGPMGFAALQRAKWIGPDSRGFAPEAYMEKEGASADDAILL